MCPMSKLIAFPERRVIGKAFAEKIIGYHGIAVIDVESTCWENNRMNNTSEIIEIGITPLVDIRNELRFHTAYTSHQYYLKPQHSTVSDFCTRLTGITSETLDTHGQSYQDVFRDIQRLYGRMMFASWGEYDRTMFSKMEELHNVRHPFLNKHHVNVKALFYGMTGIRTGVGSALEFLNLQFIGQPHSGMDDSYNIARILLKLLGQYRA